MNRFLSNSILLISFIGFTSISLTAGASGFSCFAAFKKDSFYQNVFNRAKAQYASNRTLNEVEFKEVLSSPERTLAFIEAKTDKSLNSFYSIEKYLNKISQKEKNKLKRIVEKYQAKENFSENSLKNLLIEIYRSIYKPNKLFSSLKRNKSFAKAFGEIEKEVISSRLNIKKSSDILLTDLSPHLRKSKFTEKIKAWYRKNQFNTDVVLLSSFWIMENLCYSSNLESIGLPSLFILAPLYLPSIRSFMLQRLERRIEKPSLTSSSDLSIQSHLTPFSRAELLQKVYNLTYIGIFINAFISNGFAETKNEVLLHMVKPHEDRLASFAEDYRLSPEESARKIALKALERMNKKNSTNLDETSKEYKELYELYMNTGLRL